MTNPWDKIFIEDFTAGYEIANNNYLQTAKKADLWARATCSLLLEKYDNALLDFLLLNEKDKQEDMVGDITYLYIALCYYAKGEIEKAIDYFKYPVTNSKYVKYTSDIIVPPCVLFYIAHKLSKPDLIKIAKKALSKSKLDVALFLLEQISEAEINGMYEQQLNETIRNRYQCKVEFYKAAAELAKNNFEKSREHLANCVRLKGKYLEFVYYLAKVEQDKLNNHN